MTRKTLLRLLLAIVAVLSIGSMAEAAGLKKVVHRRPKHSTRVTSGRPAKRKPAIIRKHTPPNGSTTARSKTIPKPKKPARRPTTKPR